MTQYERSIHLLLSYYNNWIHDQPRSGETVHTTLLLTAATHLSNE